MLLTFGLTSLIAILIVGRTPDRITQALVTALYSGYLAALFGVGL